MLHSKVVWNQSSELVLGFQKIYIKTNYFFFEINRTSRSWIYVFLLIEKTPCRMHINGAEVGFWLSLRVVSPLFAFPKVVSPPLAFPKGGVTTFGFPEGW